MALMLILARLAAGAGCWLWLLGGLALAMPWIAMHFHAAWPGLDFLNDRSFNWLGLISRKPITEDYAPLFPWLGVMCWGLASGQWVLRHRAVALERWSAALCQGHPAAPAMQALAWMGRWSLSYYMLHQPLLIGALSLLALLR
jgi:uncharacterized membrane protein